MHNAARGVVNGAWLRGPQRDDLLATTFDRAAIGIVEVDRDGRILRANRYIADLIGYGPDELLGRSLFDPELTDDGVRDAAEFRRQVAGEIESYTIEKRFKRKDGVGFSWAAVTSSSVRDRDGNFIVRGADPAGHHRSQACRTAAGPSHRAAGRALSVDRAVAARRQFRDGL